MTWNTNLLLHSVLDVVIEAGFTPMDDLVEDLGQNGEDADVVIRQAGIIGYFIQRGWAAVRPEDDGGATLARWNPDGLEIRAVTANGATTASARFDTTAKGLAWFTAAIA